MLPRLRDSWVSSSLLLVAGTVAGQVVALLVSPLLTRLLAPSAFGLLALYAALVSSVGMSVSGRYDIAALLPGEESVAREVLGLAMWVTLGTTVLAFAILVVGGDAVLRLLNGEALGAAVYLVPVGLWLTGVRVTLGYWANRHGDFRTVAIVQLLQACTTAAISVGLGLSGLRTAALIAGYLGGLIAAAAVLVYRYRADLQPQTLRWSRKKVEIARGYSRFPLFSASSAILDGIHLNLPVFFLSAYFAPTIVGYYAMVLRVANAPLSFVSTSVSQVHMHRLMGLLRTNADARQYLFGMARAMMLFGAFPTALLMFIGPWLFATLFGPQWRTAGEYLQLLMPSLLIRFVASTLSVTIDVTNNSHLGAIWKIVALVTASIVLFSFGRAGDAHRVMLMVSIADVALYLFYFYLQYRAVCNPKLRDQ